MRRMRMDENMGVWHWLSIFLFCITDCLEDEGSPRVVLDVLLTLYS